MDINSYHNKLHDGSATLPITDRSRVRFAARGHHDRALVHAILDAGFVAHVGVATEAGPMVIPQAYVRIGDDVFLHGSPASRLVRLLGAGAPACVTVTHLDAVVLARSAFHHSFNYRSVVLFGEAEALRDLDEKAAVLDAFVDHVVPGRSTELRASTRRELRATAVLRFPIREGSAKVAEGFRSDEPEDEHLPVWAGLVPLHLVAGDPVAQRPEQPEDVPASVGRLRARHAAPLSSAAG